MYLHFTIKPGGAVTQRVPEAYNAFAYVIEGEGTFGPDQEAASSGQMVILDGDGDNIEIAVPASAASPLELLLVAGEPLNEPVARYGPFVMNTEAEIHQAIADYRSGRMGEINF
jgi:redox-sensitive bicupin YhaK (pirin superfamily)